jgi:hypothetical protein
MFPMFARPYGLLTLGALMLIYLHATGWFVEARGNGCVHPDEQLYSLGAKYVGDGVGVMAQYPPLMLKVVPVVPPPPEAEAATDGNAVNAPGVCPR